MKLTLRLYQVHSSGLLGETMRPSSTICREFNEARVTSSTSMILEKVESSSARDQRSSIHEREDEDEDGDDLAFL